MNPINEIQYIKQVKPIESCQQNKINLTNKETHQLNKTNRSKIEIIEIKCNKANVKKFDDSFSRLPPNYLSSLVPSQLSFLPVTLFSFNLFGMFVLFY